MLRIEVRAVKCRIPPVGRVQASAIWAEGQFWCSIDGEARATENIRDKYPGYMSYNLNVVPKPFEALPSRALVLWRTGSDPAVRTRHVVHDTVRVHNPVPARGGLVMMRTVEAKPDLAPLASRVWKQVGNIGDDTLLMLLLVLNPGFDHTALKDDVTGEAYPYRIQRVVLLIKK